MDLDQELAEADRREAEEMKFRAKRRRNKLISHTIAGAITFGFCHVLMGCAGCADSVSSLFVGAIIMGIVGAVAGFIVSYQRLSTGGGAFVGTLAFLALLTILNLIGGSLNGSTFLLAVGVSAIGGGIPGAFIGLHVSMDT